MTIMTKYPAYISIRSSYKTTHDATGIPAPGGKTFNVGGALLHRLVPCRRAGEAGIHLERWGWYQSQHQTRRYDTYFAYNKYEDVKKCIYI